MMEYIVPVIKIKEFEVIHTSDMDTASDLNCDFSVSYADIKNTDTKSNTQSKAAGVLGYSRYTGDNLWGDIYKGKEKVVDFADDEPEPPPLPPLHMRVWYTLRHHAESLRQLMDLRREKDERTEFIDDLYYEKLLLERGERTADSTPAPRTGSGEEEYDSDNLWSAGMKQGRQNPNT